MQKSEHFFLWGFALHSSLVVALAIFVTSKSLPFRTRCASQIDTGTDQTKPNFVIRSGDSITQSLSRLSQITGTIYIIDKDDDATRHVELTAQSQPITNWADMKNYLAALGYTADLLPVEMDKGEGNIESDVLSFQIAADSGFLKSDFWIDAQRKQLLLAAEPEL